MPSDYTTVADSEMERVSREFPGPHDSLGKIDYCQFVRSFRGWLTLGAVLNMSGISAKFRWAEWHDETRSSFSTL